MFENTIDWHPNKWELACILSAKRLERVENSMGEAIVSAQKELKTFKDEFSQIVEGLALKRLPCDIGFRGETVLEDRSHMLAGDSHDLVHGRQNEL